jgi:ankyrin repeat protein
MNLEAAIKAKDAECVRQLLASGADPNATDEWREPLLIVAIKWGQVEIVELLISAGADVTVVNGSDNGSTPLHFAAGATVWVPNVTIAKLLLDKGARVDATTGSGTTPLMWVAQSREESALDVAALLIAHGASLHLQGEDGTALQYAKDTRNSKMVDMLYKRGKVARLASGQVSGPPNAIKKFFQSLGIAAPTPTCPKCGGLDVGLTGHLRRHAEWKCHACGKLWYVKKK